MRSTFMRTRDIIYCVYEIISQKNIIISTPMVYMSVRNSIL